MQLKPTKIERFPLLVPFPARGDSELYDESAPMMQTPMDNEMGIVDWCVTDVSHGFHIFHDDEIAGILYEACTYQVDWQNIQDVVLTEPI